MLVFSVFLALCIFKVESVEQNVSCPIVAPRELDLKNLDGKWYMISIASDMDFEGECASVVFSHKTDNTTDMSISWMNGNTTSFYNGSVELSFDPNSNSTEGDLLTVTYTDDKTETYSFLALDYEHYAVVFACYDDSDNTNTSTYELWELSRTPHVKPKHVSKIFNALSTYNLQDTPMLKFNSTESCISSGAVANPTSLVLTSAAALAMFRRLY
ncbi:lipocalin / cytosolic fatty-acid binding protein family domain-containing protein [Phthorimaea operculella]|nr:lipocalin / cytosolic fatty-acid binding protein family domain-containing protein [Phthorimaea operculella]